MTRERRAGLGFTTCQNTRKITAESEASQVMSDASHGEGACCTIEYVPHPDVVSRVAGIENEFGEIDRAGSARRIDREALDLIEHPLL